MEDRGGLFAFVLYWLLVAPVVYCDAVEGPRVYLVMVPVILNTCSNPDEILTTSCHDRIGIPVGHEVRVGIIRLKL